VTIHRDVDLYAGILGEGDGITHELAAGRSAWLQVARGSVSLNGQQLSAGDGAAIETAGAISLAGNSVEAEILLFDMAP
jgi:redox-sensitive bicupin YhaK (pirin superfamily)